MSARKRLRGTPLVASLALLVGCHDYLPTAPVVTTPVPIASAADRTAMQCRMDMKQRALSCITLPKPGTTTPGVLGDRIVGGQDVYVKLASSNTSYDGGTEILASDVTLQNLSRFSMGTTDGMAVAPIRVFFQLQPTLLTGTGTITVANADGTDTFTASGQPYFQYSQIVAPYEISVSRLWQFNVPSTVGSFQFTVYVSAPQTDEIGTLLDRVWEGSTNDGWLVSCNWSNGAAPVDTSTVAIPTDSLIVGAHSQPVLTESDTIANLRVGYGSSLDLGGNTLTVGGIVDAVGALTNGTTALTGSAAVLSGTVNKLVVSGGARLQRPTVATGAVSVTGALTVSNQPLSIAIP
jgi:hypothetical protein